MGIRKLARELELSIGTVSRALNDRPDVNEATRRRVKAAALAAGYEPNQAGRSLRKGCTGVVAAIIPSAGVMPSAEGTFFHVLEGVRRTLVGEGLDLIVLLRGPAEDPLAHLQRIVSRRLADGLIITQTRPLDPRIPYLAEAGMRFVAFGRSAGCEGHPWVDFDFETAAVEAARLFVESGHRRIALVVNEHGLNYNAILRGAFRTAAGKLGLPAGAASTLETRDGLPTAEARAALADPATAPTAFLAGNESIAAGLYAELAALGRPVGAATAVVSALPALTPEAHVPALTSFDTSLEAVGRALAVQLLARLPGLEPRRAPPCAPAPTRLVTRASHILRPAPLAALG
jgi:DNA-binding LacI/PurR family transcriptional regulator